MVEFVTVSVEGLSLLNLLAILLQQLDWFDRDPRILKP